MGDKNELDATEGVRIIGASPDGTETNPLQVNANQEAFSRDCVDNGGEDGVIVVTSSTAQEVKVGGSARALRKLILVQADKKIKFGFSSGTQSFTLAKNSILRFRSGPNTQLWVIADTTTANVSIGEVS